MQSASRALVPARASLLAWGRRHPDAVALGLAAALGLVLLPAAVERSGLERSGQPFVGPIWLVVTLVLTVIVLRARRGLARAVDAAVRGALARVPPVPGSGGASLDVPTTGALAARGIFDLGLLLLIQAMLRPPLALASEGYAPPALVDGAVVALVVVVALLMFARLHRLNRSLVEHLCRAGLDALVPTAGFAGPFRLPGRTADRALAPPAPTRILDGQSTAPASDQPTVVPPGVDQPTVVPPGVDQPTVVPRPADQPTVVPSAPDQPTIVPTAAPAAPDHPTVVPPAADQPAVEPPAPDQPTVVPGRPPPTAAGSDDDRPSRPPAADGRPGAANQTIAPDPGARGSG
jgi:hypothetical protein